MTSPHIDPTPPALATARGPALVGAVGVAGALVLLALVPQFEGTKLKSYADIGGVITACTGHTEPGLRLGQTFSPAQCTDMLASDLVKHHAGLDACLRTDPPPQVRAALVSWAFNIGVGKACGSTVIRKANAGDYAAACAGLEDWAWVAGRDCRRAENTRFCGGIVTRRQAERALCEGRHQAWAAAQAAASRAPAPGTAGGRL